MCKAGSTEPLTILRDGKRMTLDVVCAERPANFGVARAGQQGSGKAESSRFEKLGIQVEDLTPQVAEQLGIEAEHGVVITDVRSGSPADLAGLTTGMVITEANRQPVKTVEDFRKCSSSQPLDKGVLLLVRSARRQPLRGHPGRIRVIRATEEQCCSPHLRGLWQEKSTTKSPAHTPEALSFRRHFLRRLSVDANASLIRGSGPTMGPSIGQHSWLLAYSRKYGQDSRKIAA